MEKEPDQAYVELEKSSEPPKNKRWLEKCVHVVSVVTLVFFTHAVVYAQWILPFYYAIFTPILMTIRVVMYWKNKWQYFLLDFCYFANTLLYVFLWVADDPRMFCTVFAVANGPLLWAMLVYRNSLVFHSIDKMTSAYIHLFPGLLSFCIRWFPKKTSLYWFKDFVPNQLEFDWESLIWLILIPQLFFMIHSAFYVLVVVVIKKPSEEYLSSISYLGNKPESCLSKLFNCGGGKCRRLMFVLFNWLFCIVTLIGIFLVYNFFVAHCVLLIALTALTTFNGGMYYIDVFRVRGFVDD